MLLQLRHSAEITDNNADKSGELKKSVDEIRNLQAEISTLRQENLQLKVKIFSFFQNCPSKLHFISLEMFTHCGQMFSVVYNVSKINQPQKWV